MIETDRLVLVPCTLEHFEAIEKDPAQLARLVEARIAVGWPNFPDAILYFREPLRMDPEMAGWGTWLVIEKNERVLIGEGGYGGKPGEQGQVEIGYAIVPSHRGRGYASEFAAALVKHAFGDARVRRVEAGTLNEGEHAEASASVLRRAGLAPVGETEDCQRWALDREGWEQLAREAEM
ncbi:MAG: GNAT family N-acetyltransferase [Planctomycetes bacterium]|nr:GNAT family N-acetyltransferase [Planctomycetota bacterium]